MFFGKSKKKAVSQPLPHRSTQNDKFLEAQALVRKGESISYAIMKSGLRPTNGQMTVLRGIQFDRDCGWMFRD